MKSASISPLLIVLTGLLLAMESAFATDRPNVLMIVVDDLNDWVGTMYGHPDTTTPNFDRLASEGVMFLDAHATSPICGPSRAAFLSGMRASTSGFHDNSGRFTDFEILLRHANLPQFFKQAGYRTFGAGKLFHYYYPEYWDESVDKGPRMYRANMPKRHGHEIPGIMDWGPLERSEQEMDDYRMAQFAIDKLQREHEDPFFIACGIYLPHLPWYAPKEFFEPFPLESIRLPIENPNELDDLPPAGLRLVNNQYQQVVRDLGREVHREAVQAFLASTHFADAQIGRILAALDASPYADNTIVVLFSDHGNHLTEKHRWHKDTLWRESTRVPLVIRAPGMAGNGLASPRMASLLDVYPTLADLIGVEAPSHLEGRSLKPLLENPLQQWDHAAITNRRPGDASVRTEDWSYIRYADGSEELYSRRHDPREWINLANVPEYAQVKQQLAAEFEVLEINRLQQANGGKLESIGEVALSGVDFYVSPTGSDANDGSEAQPFATLSRARDAVREIKSDLDRDIVVSVAAGDYFLDETLTFTSEDSAVGGQRVIYRAEGDPGSARLLGGMRLRGWEPVGEGIFRLQTAWGHVFETLYENGIRGRKARFPNHEWHPRFPLSGADYLLAESGELKFFRWHEGDLDAVAGFEPGSVANAVIWPWGPADWQKLTRRITGIDWDTRTIHVPDHEQGGRADLGTNSRFYLEGVRSFLNQPGEFFHDTESGYLYYWPRFGHPDNQDLIGPLLDRIVSFEGNSVDDPVSSIVLEGFTLAYTNTFSSLIGPSHFPWSPATRHGSTGEGAHGIIQMRYSEKVEIRNNHIHSSGYNGIYLEQANRECIIYGNWIQGMGISGICFAYHRESRQRPNDFHYRNIIDNNRIHDLGAIAVDSAGINLWGGTENLIQHCEIFDGARYGISLRGPFTQMRMGADGGTISHTNRPIAQGNQIRYNHFYRLGQDSGDTGAVHMAGISSLTDHPVNTMEQLLIESIQAHPSMKDLPPNGIFFDYTDGVTDQVMRDIEIRDTTTPFRTNRTNVRHTFDNVSWMDGFDSARMNYSKIGLRDTFHPAFSAPAEVLSVLVRNVTADASKLSIRWQRPNIPDYKGVWIYLEGSVDFEPIFVEASAGDQIQVDRPLGDRLPQFRLRVENQQGHLSAGFLIAAGEVPAVIGSFHSIGGEESILLSWESDDLREHTLRVEFADGAYPTREVAIEEGQLRLQGLPNNRTFRLQLTVRDPQGHWWSAGSLSAVSGTAIPIPSDFAAHWQFAGVDVSMGRSLGDLSGRGNTLFVDGGDLRLMESPFGEGIQFDGGPGHLRFLDASPLAIGQGDFAVSLWIRRTGSDRMAGRIIEFGGGSRGAWEHWGASLDADAPPPQGVSLISDDIQLGAILAGSGRNYQVRTKGLPLVDEWSHVVINIERGSSMTLWLNGELLGSSNIRALSEQNLRGHTDWLIGRMAGIDHPNTFWTGAIDNLRIYSRSLTNDEILALLREKENQ